MASVMPGKMVDLIYSVVLGTVAGFIPVYLGLIPFPLFRRLSSSKRDLVISFSIGILLFLFADVTGEAVELSKTTGSGPVLLSFGLVLGIAGPVLVSYRRREQSADNPPKAVIGSEAAKNSAKLFTAYVIALGIGLHNLGEGLALGSAYARGSIALTGVLVVGFALHNGTEGIGITGPISGIPIRLEQPLLMGFLAGFPTIIGSVVGSIAYSDLIGALFFSTAAGALLYVIVELLRISYSPRNTFAGIVTGILLMYFTDLLLSI